MLYNTYFYIEKLYNIESSIEFHFYRQTTTRKPVATDWLYSFFAKRLNMNSLTVSSRSGLHYGLAHGWVGMYAAN